VELNVAHWEPPAELMRLLEAMACDIVESTDADVAIGNADNAAASWRKIDALQVRMRLLIGDAIEDPAGMHERVVPPELHVLSELRQRSH
jgi:hypothetical protein